MNSVADAFAYAFRDPRWPGKMIVQALILIIPIVGWIAMTGWLMLAFENARMGRAELPPAGFHLARGIGVFGVFFIYGLALNIPAVVLYTSGGIASAGSHEGLNVGPSLSALGFLWGFLAGLFLNFLVPSLIVNTYHGGFVGGLDVQRVWGLATTNLNNSVVAGLMIFVASLIGGLGLIACCIGFFFTVVYQNAIQAGVAAWFERVQAAPAAPGTPPV